MGLSLASSVTYSSMAPSGSCAKRPTAASHLPIGMRQNRGLSLPVVSFPRGCKSAIHLHLLVPLTRAAANTCSTVQAVICLKTHPNTPSRSVIDTRRSPSILETQQASPQRTRASPILKNKFLLPFSSMYCYYYGVYSRPRMRGLSLRSLSLLCM